MLRLKHKTDDCLNIFKACVEACEKEQGENFYVKIDKGAIRYMWKYYEGNKVDFSMWVCFLFDVARESGYTLKINRFNVMKTNPRRLRKYGIVGYINFNDYFAEEKRLGFELRDRRIPKREKGTCMGFFSDLKEDIEIDRSNVSSEEDNKRDSMERVAKLGMVGVERYLDKANEYIDSWDKKKPCTFVVTGPEGSGKSALAEAIFKDRDMRYAKVYMGAVQNAKKPLLLFQNLIPAEGGFIIEGFDQVSNPRLKNVIYMLIAGCLSLPNRKKEDLSQLIIVLPMKYKIANFFFPKSTCDIIIDYKRHEYVDMFLWFCQLELGMDLKDIPVNIDNKVLYQVGKALNGNVALYKRWTKNLVKLANEKGGLVVNKKNIRDILSSTLELNYTPEVDLEELSDE